MNNDAMTTNLSPNQSLDTDSSAQESPMPNDVLKNSELPDDNQTALDEQRQDEVLDDDDVLEEGSDDINEDVDDSDDDETTVAGQAVPVIVDMTHTVTEDQ